MPHERGHPRLNHLGCDLNLIFGRASFSRLGGPVDSSILGGTVIMYWAVCRTECGREMFAVKMLALRGFKETYLPLIKARKTRHWTADAAPLFKKKYLFGARPCSHCG
jgi:hypothetical protein